ncbi:hypothetical protein [Bacteriovorax sp. Seq25_V]|uniref:hypothetical protein n=1 Tax=Bacteriovorax sp. Seq25_V TaxID=1201288 RepID=UPI00038A4355|nr:hypothetical protein [Bacteriovorax sp. Seq25_V]EQC46319.1 hypothetical protein M900_1044 [Bacteriovorax sp. Seq25_V]
MEYLTKMFIVMALAYSSLAMSTDSNMAVNNSFIFELINSHHLEVVSKSKKQWLNQMAHYRIFYVEGENLKNSCETMPKVYYANSFEQNSVETSIVATLQKIIFDHTIPAIEKYSRALDLNENEYFNMVENLIRRSCSSNLSVISHRRIKKKFIDFRKNNSYVLPSLEGNPLYTPKVVLKQSREEKIAKELYYTVGLFEMACSWGQRVEALRGLMPLIQNPSIAAFIIRQMSGLKIADDANFNSRFLTESQDTTRVHCDGLICREKSSAKFKEDFVKSIGHQSILSDLKSNYCHSISKIKKDDEFEVDQKITKIIQKYSGFEGSRMLGQFIALLTKIPDFNVWTDDAKLLDEYMKFGLDHFWDGWAMRTVKHLENNLMYEEPLELEVVDHNLFLDPEDFKPRIELDLNSGEFDKSVAMKGKITFNFDINILDLDLAWIYHGYREINHEDKEALEKLDNLIKQYVIKDFKLIKKEFESYIIDGDLVDLLVNEIKDQILFFRNMNLKMERKLVSIPVNVNVSPFALIYLKNKRVMDEANQKEIARDEQFEAAKRIDSMALEPNK